MIEIDVLHRHGISYILFSYGNKYCLTKSLLGVKISERVSLSESNDTLLHTPKYTCPCTRARGEIQSKLFLRAICPLAFCSTGCLSECVALHCSLQTLVESAQSCTPAHRIQVLFWMSFRHYSAVICYIYLKRWHWGSLHFIVGNLPCIRQHRS